MSIAASSIGDAPISAQVGLASQKKGANLTPRNRVLVAKGDILPPPEPR